MEPTISSGNGFHYKLAEEERGILAAVGIIFFCLGVLGNLAVIVYNIFLNHNKTPNSRLVTNLALADLLVCSALYSIGVIHTFSSYDLKQMKREELFCKLKHCIVYFSLFLSIMFLLAITIDKYLYFTKPLKYPMFVTSRRINILIGCIWVTALAQLPAIYFTMTKPEINLPCNMAKAVSWLQVILQILPICAMTILNCEMFKIVRRQRKKMALEMIPHRLEQSYHRQMEPSEKHSDGGQSEPGMTSNVASACQIEQSHHRGKELQELKSERPTESSEIKSEGVTWLRHVTKELKAVKTFAIIVGVLTCCFVPFIVWNILCSHVGLRSHLVRVIIQQLVGFNSIANAFIYALRHQKYIRAYKKLFSSAWAGISRQMRMRIDWLRHPS